jgi:hypothetical protein
MCVFVNPLPHKIKNLNGYKFHLNNVNYGHLIGSIMCVSWSSSGVFSLESALQMTGVLRLNFMDESVYKV